MSKFERKMARKSEKKLSKNIVDCFDDFSNSDGSFSIPPELRNLFPVAEVCFGEVDENGDDIVYDMMSLSTEEFNAKLENMGKGAK